MPLVRWQIHVYRKTSAFLRLSPAPSAVRYSSHEHPPRIFIHWSYGGMLAARARCFDHARSRVRQPLAWKSIAWRSDPAHDTGFGLDRIHHRIALSARARGAAGHALGAR